MIDTISSPADSEEQVFRQKLDCGFAASGEGGQPCDQALNKAEEIKAAAY
jgi:hypothetical protein